MYSLAPDKSRFISPVGYSVLLPMVAEACGDEFKSEMISELSLGEPSFEDFREAVSIMLSSLPALDIGTEVSFANMALAVDAEQEVYPKEVRDNLEIYYNALVAEGKRSDGFLDAVSEWIKKHTLGRITERLNVAGIVYMNSALAFQASLNPGFNPKLTVERNFNGREGKPVLIPMMHALYPVPYLQTESYDAIKLFLGEQKKFSFTAILPQAGTEIAQVLSELENNGIPEKWQQDNLVNISLPKINLRGGLPLTLFNEKLAGIVDERFSAYKYNPDEKIGVVQTGHVIMDESGFMGAGKSVMDILDYADSPSDGAESTTITFNADRPFIFTVMVEGTGIALYTGLYCNQGFDN